MRRLYIEIILISLISLNIYAQRGRVQIKDGTLVTDSGTLLRGAHTDTHDESLQSDSWVTYENIRKMKDYGLNSIRLYTESPWRGDTAGYRSAFVDSVVKWTRQENMYVILVWAGWTNNETTHEDSIAHNFHRNFWRFYAPRYKDETHVIYEICSEPGPSNTCHFLR
jgi:aryl-phospho-beta-D-glucosidase BglC (GH1 family)